MMVPVPPSLADASWPIRTPRLLIRPATPADAVSVHRFRRLPAVTEWMTSRTNDVESFAARFSEPERLGRVLVVEHAGRIVGDLMLRVDDAWGQTEVARDAVATQAELGWAFDPAVHGQGLAREACTALLGVCFDSLGLRRVTAGCFADNEPSWRLMERLGMRREAHLVADALHRSGRWLDSYTYALLRDEWQARRDETGRPAVGVS
jgi:RimJ/RimL family protein N-acetyltransferase